MSGPGQFTILFYDNMFENFHSRKIYKRERYYILLIYRERNSRTNSQQDQKCMLLGARQEGREEGVGNRGDRFSSVSL